MRIYNIFLEYLEINFLKVEIREGVLYDLLQGLYLTHNVKE